MYILGSSFTQMWSVRRMGIPINIYQTLQMICSVYILFWPNHSPDFTKKVPIPTRRPFLREIQQQQKRNMVGLRMSFVAKINYSFWKPSVILVSKIFHKLKFNKKFTVLDKAAPHVYKRAKGISTDDGCEQISRRWRKKNKI